MSFHGYDSLAHRGQRYDAMQNKSMYKSTCFKVWNIISPHTSTVQRSQSSSEGSGRRPANDGSENVDNYSAKSLVRSSA